MNTCRNILIAYGTRAGSTAEIAEYMGTLFRDMGATVDVLPVEQVQAMTPYCAVILGTATRIGKPLAKVTNFIKKYERELAPLPVAYFVVGITMREDTPEHRAQAGAVLEPLRALKQPVREGLFAGKIEYATIEQPMRFFISHSKDLNLREGDWRDWEKIRAWVNELAPMFMGIAALPLETT